MNVLKRVEKLEAEIKRLKQRTTVGGGGVPTSTTVTNLTGFPGDPTLVLRGDGTFGPPLGGSGVGQWIPSPVGDGQMLLNAEGHPVLVWWDGP